MPQSKPPRLLTLDEVLTLHEAALHQYGGIDGVRERGSLESAVAMPQQGFGGDYAHAFPFEMAAAYAFHIAQNQAFLDGNKRTAPSSAITFLRLNGWSLVADEMDAADQVLRFATRNQDKAGFAKWLEAHSKPRPTMELREFFAAVNYSAIHKVMESGLLDEDERRAHQGRKTTMLEAAAAIPAINEANIAGTNAEKRGDEKSATILFGQSHLLAALYRVAEDMGYEW